MAVEIRVLVLALVVGFVLGGAFGCKRTPAPAVVIPPDRCHMQIRADCQLETVCGERRRVLPIFACLARVRD